MLVWPLVACLALTCSASPTAGADALLRRLLPSAVADNFAFYIIPPVQGQDTFTVGARNGKVTIGGNNNLSISTGLGWYLNNYCNASVQWSGNQLALPPILPTVANTTISSPMKWRYYMNVCTLSYTMPWWTWERWERELDWMALHGINMPLAFTGQEYTMAEVFGRLGVSEADLETWFVGPAFLAWGRMGNIRTYAGPLGKSWRAAQAALQIRFLQRARELDMVPVMPAFAGHVPAALQQLYPNATITRSPLWAGFNSTLSGAYLLDANDPLFQTIGKLFLDVQTAQFGTNHVYNADTFNEMVPARSDPAFLKQTAAALYRSLSASDPDAIWMIQGWMFFFEPDFWGPTEIKAYLDGVENDRMLILDLNAFSDAQWKRTESFYGKPFIWCILDNGGGSTGMYGGLDQIATEPLTDLRLASTMVGTGITPEGVLLNPISYELFTEVSWMKSFPNVMDWVPRYVRRRYGPNVTQDAVDAWKILHYTLYNTTDAEADAMVNDRPRIDKTSLADWQDCAQVVAAWRLLHTAAPRIRNVPGFRYDYVDLTRQVLSNLFEDVFHLLVGAYNNADLTSFTALRTTMLELLSDLDAVLATHDMWMLGPWTEGARSWGETPAEQDLFEYGARHLLTIWGPSGELNGYVSRSLSGLISDFNLPRFKMFSDQLADSLKNRTPFYQELFGRQCFETIEKPWAEAHNKHFPTQPIGDTVDVIDRVFRKYGGDQTVYMPLYTMYFDRDGSGQLWKDFGPAMNKDPTTLQFLCTSTPSCGGVVHNGWFKPIGTKPVSFATSTLWVKNNSSAPTTESCVADECTAAASVDDCVARCGCGWLIDECMVSGRVPPPPVTVVDESAGSRRRQARARTRV